MTSLEDLEKVIEHQRDAHTASIEELCDLAFYTAELKGFHESQRPFSESCMLIVTEVAEAVEAWRKNDQIEMAEELADVLIRVFDTAVEFDLDLAEALLAKMKFNLTRPHKHGKRA